MATLFDHITEEKGIRTILKEFPDLERETAAIIFSGNLEEHQIIDLFNSGQTPVFWDAVKAIENGALNAPEWTEKARNIRASYTGGKKRFDWEYNHQKITIAFQRLLINSNRIPTTDQLSKETGLSRVTISKHLQEFTKNEFFGDQVQKYRVGLLSLMDRMLGLAMLGDIKAAKLYFDMMAKLDPALSTSTIGAAPGKAPELITGPVKVHPGDKKAAI